GLRRNTYLSPSLLVTSDTVSPNNSSCSVPSASSLRTWGSVSAVTKRKPCWDRSWRPSALSMPRSPTNTTSHPSKSSTSLRTWSATVVGSARFPSYTCTLTGSPSASVSSPRTICFLYRLPSRLYPAAASSFFCPSTYEDADKYTHGHHV